MFLINKKGDFDKNKTNIVFSVSLLIAVIPQFVFFRKMLFFPLRRPKAMSLAAVSNTFPSQDVTSHTLYSRFSENERLGSHQNSPWRQRRRLRCKFILAYNTGFSNLNKRTTGKEINKDPHYFISVNVVLHCTSSCTLRFEYLHLKIIHNNTRLG